MTRVLLLRHAETAAPTVFHGAESDIGLSERGRLQVAALAPLLAAEKPDVVISSAMRRALDTARPIAAACRVELRVEPDLHERRVGPLSGMPFNTSPWPETLARWTGGELGYAPEGAESFLDIRQRISPVWQAVTRDHQDKTLVMVAHGVVIKVLLMSLEVGLGPGDWHRFHCPNLGVHELRRERQSWRIVRLGEVPAKLLEVAPA